MPECRRGAVLPLGLELVFEAPVGFENLSDSTG